MVSRAKALLPCRVVNTDGISTCTLIDDAIIIKSEWLRKICLPFLEIQIEIHYDSLLESLMILRIFLSQLPSNQ